MSPNAISCKIFLIFILLVFVFDSSAEARVSNTGNPTGGVEESEPTVRRKPRRKKRRKRRRRRRRRKKPKTQEIDLSALDSASEKKPKAGGASSFGRPMSVSNAPVFKSYFDFLLTNRPGKSPLSFDSFHSIILIDYIPKPGILFSTEVPFGSGARPRPRFFELDIDLSETIQIRLGKIWIPFDEGDPHVSFGGVVNTFEFNAGAQTNFLPDVWADLGIGLKFKLISTRGLKLETHLFVVNGFPDGATDPGSSTGQTVYPDFNTTTIKPDNNNDKAVGGRLSTMFANMIGIGASVYTGRYTSEGLESGRVTAIGVDGKLRLPTKTQLKIGYAFMSVTIPDGLSIPSASAEARTKFTRGGAYVELGQRFGKWRFLVRGGVQNNDSGVEDVNDRTIAGARLEYNISPMFQLSLEHRKDLKLLDREGNDLGKVNKEYTAARFVIKM